MRWTRATGACATNESRVSDASMLNTDAEKATIDPTRVVVRVALSPLLHHEVVGSEANVTGAPCSMCSEAFAQSPVDIELHAFALKKTWERR